MSFECSEERTRHVLASTRALIRSSRALNHDLQESVNTSKNAILSSYSVLERNKAVADKLNYYAEARRTFHITPPLAE